MRKLNLGCGKNILYNYENYDLYPMYSIVKQLDLNKLPLPFEDNSIDKILLSNILEHLTVDLSSFINEIARILKKDGILYINLPVWSNKLQHQRFYHCKSYLDELVKGTGKNKNYIGKHFELVYLKPDKRFNVLLMFRRLFALLRDMGYSQYEWKFKRI